MTYFKFVNYMSYRYYPLYITCAKNHIVEFGYNPTNILNRVSHLISLSCRYWARNYAGWPIFSSHLPNQGHHILADLERMGKIHWLVTQNVDSLHSKAGSTRVTELHGASCRYQRFTNWLQRKFICYWLVCSVTGGGMQIHCPMLIISKQIRKTLIKEMFIAASIFLLG